MVGGAEHVVRGLAAAQQGTGSLAGSLGRVATWEDNSQFTVLAATVSR